MRACGQSWFFPHTPITRRLDASGSDISGGEPCICRGVRTPQESFGDMSTRNRVVNYASGTNIVGTVERMTKSRNATSKLASHSAM